ncbi:MAG: hypothetical protein ABIJ21_05715 [Nanoarchaeota archaeon]
MKKKGIAWKFVLGLVIASLLMIVGCKAVANVLSVFDTGPQNSFKEFSSLLQEMASKPSGSSEPITLTLPKDGDVRGFNDDRDFSFIWKEGDAKNVGSSTNPDCEADSCVCFCKNTKGDGACESNKGRWMCESVPATIAAAFSDCSQTTTTKCVEWSRTGGFLIKPKMFDGSRPVTMTSFVVENYNGMLGICAQPPCFTPVQKKRADFHYILAKEIYSCVGEIYCVGGTVVLDSILVPIDDDKFTIVAKRVSMSTTYPAVRSDIKAIAIYLKKKDVVIDAFYLVENAENLKGPFIDTALTSDFAYNEEQTSFPFQNLLIRVIKVDPVTGAPLPGEVSEEDSFELSSEGDDILIKVDRFIDKKYVLVAIGNGNENIYGPFPEGEEPKPPFPLVFYVKEKT